MRPVKTHTLPGDGVDIHLGEWPGPGPVVLLLHGLTANLYCFEHIAGALSAGHRVLAMDLRGRGDSGKPAAGYSLERHCADIAAVVAGLGLDSISLAGHSLGAYIGLYAAARRPGMVDRLVLLDGGGALDAEGWAKVGAGIQPSVDRLGRVFPSVEAYLDQMRGSPYFNPWNQCIEDYFRHDARPVPGGAASGINPQNIAEERAALSRVDPADLHPLVSCPVLAVRAMVGMVEPDGVLLPDRSLAAMLAAMPRARSVDIAGVNHFSLVFQPNQTLNRALAEFFSEA